MIFSAFPLTDCEYCFDGGICLVQLFQFNNLIEMNCSCKNGLGSLWKLPYWNQDLSLMSLRLRNPYDEYPWSLIKNESFGLKSAWMLARIKISEEFWGINGETILGQQAQT